MPEVLSFSNIYEKLFNETSGVCPVLDSINLTDVQRIVSEFLVIENVWSLSSNIRDELNMIPIYEKFIIWGCKFACKLLELNVCIYQVDRLMDFMSSMYSYLPLSSNVMNSSMFDNQTLMALYGKFKGNCFESPKLYINIFTKLWFFCSKEIINENLFCTIMAVQCELIRDNRLNNVIEDLFDYASVVLKMYVDNHGRKINSVLIINKCSTLAQVKVRSEKHAIARLYFWWQFICSVKKENMRRMIDTCMIPFLTNLFGKYITFDKEEQFDYTASPYNCFTHSDELGQLCDFVMSRLLISIAGAPPRGLPKVSNAFANIDNDLFEENYIIEQYLQRFLVAFFYWTQFNLKTNKESAFNLLKIVSEVFLNKFVPTQGSVFTDKNVKIEPETYYVTFFTIIEMCIKMKNLLEQDFGNRSVKCVFFEHSTLISSIVTILSRINIDINLIPNGRSNTKSLLLDSLSLMKDVMTTSVDEQPAMGASVTDIWMSNCKQLIGLLWPSDCVVDRGFITVDMNQITHHWFSSQLNNRGNDGALLSENQPLRTPVTSNKVGDSVWISNIQLWCFLSQKICDGFSKDHFSLNDVKEYKELNPFIDYLRIPMIFLEELSENSHNTSDYESICEVHETLYHVFAMKATLIPGLNSNEWCGELCTLFTDHLVQFSNKPLQTSRSETKALLLNFSIRFMRLVVYYSDPMESNDDIDINYKKNPLWRCVTALATVYPMLEPANIRLTLKTVHAKERNIILDSVSSKKPIPRQFPSDCDTDYTLGLAFLATERLIAKLGHNPKLIIEAMDTLSMKLALIFDICIKKKELATGRMKQKTLSTQNIKDALTIENSLIGLLKNIRAMCYNANLLSTLNPIFSVVFSYNSGTISQSTLAFMIEFWNGVVMKNEDSVTFTQELIDSLKNTKKYNSTIQLPRFIHHSIVEATKSIPQEVVAIVGDSPKKKVVGSFLNKINNIEQLKRNEPIIENKTFVSPKRGRPSKVQTYRMTRQSSDADYTIIESPPVKRRRLTEHQKEVLSEQRNKFIPAMYNGFDEERIPKLISQDSDVSLNENIKSVNDIQSTDMDVRDNIELTQDTVKEPEDIPVACTETFVNLKNEILPLPCQDSEIITADANIIVNEIQSQSGYNKNDNDLVALNDIESTKINATSTEQNLQEKETVIEVSNDKVTPIATLEEPKRKPLLDCNPFMGSVRSPSITGRSLRMVQMALQNQLKRKDEVPKWSSPVISSAERQRPSGIMRHTWSESKKDAKVSFSEPLVHAKSDEFMVDKEEEENSPGVYLSPVFDRRQQPRLMGTPSNYDVEMSEFPVTVHSPSMFSVTCSDSRSAERVRQSMDMIDQLSPIKRASSLSTDGCDGSVRDTVCHDVVVRDTVCHDVVVQDLVLSYVGVQANMCSDAGVQENMCHDTCVLDTVLSDVGVQENMCSDAGVQESVCSEVSVSESLTNGKESDVAQATVVSCANVQDTVTDDQNSLDVHLKEVKEALDRGSKETVLYVLAYLFNKN